MDKQASKTRRIFWTAVRTEQLLDWLEENPEDCQKLFSDSSKDAKDEGRWKHMAKGTKSEFHKKIATFVFSVDSDADVHADSLFNTNNYTKSVDNYPSMRNSGAGLRYEDIDEGSNLQNLVGE